MRRSPRPVVLLAVLLVAAGGALHAGPPEPSEGPPRAGTLAIPLPIENLDAAERVLRAGIEGEPERADLHLWLAVVAETRGDLDTAKERLERAIAHRPSVARRGLGLLRDPALRALLEDLPEEPEMAPRETLRYGVRRSRPLAPPDGKPRDAEDLRQMRLREIERRTRMPVVFSRRYRTRRVAPETGEGATPTEEAAGEPGELGVEAAPAVTPWLGR